MLNDKFNKLFNTIMEEVKTSKKHIIKEDWDVEKEKYDGYMDRHQKVLIGLIQANDPSKVSQAIIAACEKKGVKNSKFYKWENAMCTAQFNCLDNVEWWKQNGFTVSPEEEKEINWYNWITNKLIEHQRLADDWEGQDWTREILEQGRAGEFLNYVDQLADSDSESLEADRVERATTHDTPMYDDAAEADSLHESKKVNTKKKVIKESARRHARRHLIKEWSYDDFVRVNKERINKIFNRLFSNPETKNIYKQELKKDVVREMKGSYYHDDPGKPEETAAYVLEKYIYQLRWNKNIYALLTDEEKVWVDKYCERFLEGMEGYVYDMYGGGGGYYEQICTMDPIYKEIVDEIVQENGGPIEESVKKPVSKRRVIKESTRRHVRRIKK